jgi:cell wall-associated NlpC family hydrolase
MLANTKHQKDRMVFSILSTLLFITASSAIYTTPSANAVQEKALEAKLITYTVPAPPENLFNTISTLDRFTNKISELEETIQQRESTIYIVKTRAEQDLEALRNTYVSMDQALIELSSYVGETPYGFGDTPARWDCSGLTLWFYQTYRGITLPHSATAQKLGGTEVGAPIPGDLVAFSYGNRSEAFHIGVYVGSGMFIHAKNPNADTVLETLDSFVKNNITVAYIRY